MTPTEIILALGTLAGVFGGVITALVTARNSVSQSQLAEQKADTDRLAEEQRLKNEEQERHNKNVDRDFERLRQEIARLEVSNTNRAVENERLSQALEAMRQVGEKRDGELITLRQDLAQERRTNAHHTERIAELEKRNTVLEEKVQILTGERDELLAAGKKPGTGPLAEKK